MTHNELLDKIYWYWRRDNRGADGLQPMVDYRRALLTVVELHKPLLFQGRFSSYYVCDICSDTYEYVGDSVQYPCPTIQAIEKELK